VNQPIDPTCGYSPEQLRRLGPPPTPAGFAEFWRATHAQAAEVPLGMVVTDDGPQRRIVRFDVLGGHRVGAWLSVPAGPVRATAVIGHGYGHPEPPGAPMAGVAMLHLCMPGFSLSRSSAAPGESAFHVIHGIGSRETYLLRACAANIWSGVRVLDALFPGLPMAYFGGSFGGGMGALAAPWEPRFSAVALTVPTFGHHPIRLQHPCSGSGEAVRRWHQTHPEVVNVLQWYDAAVAATFFRVPTWIAPADADPAVPPPGQWAVANAVPNGHIHALSSGHPTLPDEENAWNAVVEAMLLRLSSSAAAGG
jgi:cephalosporin-C deacetylase